MKHLIYLIIVITAAMAAVSCIEDEVTTSPSHQPTFSTDTLAMGLTFTGQSTPTYSMVVYNRHDKVLSIGSIALRDGSRFRINVDGVAGKSFANMEIRPNDSIYVFVEATLPPAGLDEAFDVEDHIDFVTNGVTQSVVITATGRDVERLRGVTVTEDMHLTADRPYQIFDSLVVAPGVTLTLDAGASLHFHDKASLRVRGTLVSAGTAEAPVNMTGDRTDNVVGDIPFDLMSRQWDGLYFLPGSHSNVLSHTVVRNTVNGVTADSLGTRPDGSPGLTLINCRLRNSGGYALTARHTDITAAGCELADASAGVVRLHGGTHTFNHCTLANYYLFTVIGGPALQLSHTGAPKADDIDDTGLPLMRALFSNCIIYGLGTDLCYGDLSGTDIVVNRCLLKSAGTDDDNFVMCLWDTDPLYYTVREDYIFDYRLHDESPAAAAADPGLTLPAAAADFYGTPRGSSPSLGAYQWTPAESRFPNIY